MEQAQHSSRKQQHGLRYQLPHAGHANLPTAFKGRIGRSSASILFSTVLLCKLKSLSKTRNSD